MSEMLCVEGCTVLSLGEERGGERARRELQGGHSRSLRKDRKITCCSILSLRATIWVSTHATTGTM